MRTLVSFTTVAHRDKAQHNFSFETQQSFLEHNEIFWHTIIFFRTQRNIPIHRRKLKHNKINETQQNFKVVMTRPATESDRNLRLSLVTCCKGVNFISIFSIYILYSEWKIQSINQSWPYDHERNGAIWEWTLSVRTCPYQYCSARSCWLNIIC